METAAAAVLIRGLEALHLVLPQSSKYLESLDPPGRAALAGLTVVQRLQEILCLGDDIVCVLHAACIVVLLLEFCLANDHACEGIEDGCRVYLKKYTAWVQLQV